MTKYVLMYSAPKQICGAIATAVAVIFITLGIYAAVLRVLCTKNVLFLSDIVLWNRITVSIICGCPFLLFQPYIPFLFWGLLFPVFRRCSKKDAILSGSCEYTKDNLFFLMSPEKIQQLDELHAGAKVPQGLHLMNILKYYRGMKKRVTVELYEKKDYRAYQFPLKIYLSGSCILLVAWTVYVVCVEGAIPSLNIAVDWLNMLIPTVGVWYLLYWLWKIIPEDFVHTNMVLDSPTYFWVIAVLIYLAVIVLVAADHFGVLSL